MGNIYDLEELLEKLENLSFNELMFQALKLGIDCKNCTDKKCIIEKIKYQISLYYSIQNENSLSR